jgi:hypothetical protein
MSSNSSSTTGMSSSSSSTASQSNQVSQDTETITSTSTSASSSDSTSTSDNAIDVYIYLPTDLSTAVFSSTNNVSSSASTWETINITKSSLDDGTSPDWDTANQTASVFIRMRSVGSNNVRVGDIKLNYYSQF